MGRENLLESLKCPKLKTRSRLDRVVLGASFSRLRRFLPMIVTTH